MSKKGFLASDELMEAVRALDYMAQYQVCEAFKNWGTGTSYLCIRL